MKNTIRNNETASQWAKHGLRLSSAVLLLSATGLAYAQDPVTMAPPVQGAYDTDPGSVPDNASQDTVFNWREVPANQRVPVTRAVFDKGGYQLYDNVGETIIVPFSSDNLYVMKFGISDDGSTYFVNDGSAPTLYLPHDGYLENATVTGAKWYPFPQDYHPAEPVFLGIAPSWDAYADMGWYPDMAYYGGYYSHGPFISGAVVFPTFGLFIDIGGHSYHGWAGYHNYYDGHPDAFRLTIVNNDFYRWGGHADYGRSAFFGGGHGYGYGGGYHSYGSHGYGGGYHGFQGGNRTFGNVSGGVRPSGGGGGYQSYSSHTFRGGQSYGGGNSGGHSYGSGNYGGHSYGGGSGGGRSFSGGNFGGGNRTFGNAGGNARPSGGDTGGGSHSFSGGGNSGGFAGGGHSFGGGGGGFHGGGGFGGGHGR